MARFYFDFDNGDDQTIDDVGLTYVSPLVAKEAAMRALPDFARDLFPVSSDRTASASGDRTMTVTVRNEAGASIFAAELKFKTRWID